MSEPVSQVKYLAGEHRANASMKRRKADLLCAEAAVLEDCADRIERAIEIDAKRNSVSSASGDSKDSVTPERRGCP